MVRCPGCGEENPDRFRLCGFCGDYGCEKLTGFLANVPEAKANLEARRMA